VAEDDGSGELQLSTTPLRLLNAVDARVSLLQVAPAPVCICIYPRALSGASPAAHAAAGCAAACNHMAPTCQYVKVSGLWSSC
jgi:hypothetical protein